MLALLPCYNLMDSLLGLQLDLHILSFDSCLPASR